MARLSVAHDICTIRRQPQFPMAEPQPRRSCWEPSDSRAVVPLQEVSSGEGELAAPAAMWFHVGILAMLAGLSVIGERTRSSNGLVCVSRGVPARLTSQQQTGPQESLPDQERIPFS